MRFLKYFSYFSILCIIRSKNLSNLHQRLFQLVILVTKIEIILWEKSAITVILSCLYLTVSSSGIVKKVRPRGRPPKSAQLFHQKIEPLEHVEIIEAPTSPVTTALNPGSNFSCYFYYRSKNPQTYLPSN